MIIVLMLLVFLVQIVLGLLGLTSAYRLWGEDGVYVYLGILFLCGGGKK